MENETKQSEENEVTLEDIGTYIGKKFADLEMRIEKLEEDKRNRSASNFIKKLKLSLNNR